MLKEIFSRILEKKLPILGILILIILRKLVRNRHQKRELEKELITNLFYKKKSTELTIKSILSYLPQVDDKLKLTIAESNIISLLSQVEAKKISNLEIFAVYFSNVIQAFNKLEPIHEITLGQVLYKLRSLKWRKTPKEFEFALPFSAHNIFQIKGFDSKAKNKRASLFRPAATDHAIIQHLKNSGFVPIFTTHMAESFNMDDQTDSKLKEELSLQCEIESEAKLILQGNSRFSLLLLKEIRYLDSVLERNLFVLSFSPSQVNFDSIELSNYYETHAMGRITLLSKFHHDLVIAARAIIYEKQEYFIADSVRSLNPIFRMNSNTRQNIGYVSLFEDPNQAQLNILSKDPIFHSLEKKGHNINLIHTHFFEWCLKLVQKPCGDDPKFGLDKLEPERGEPLFWRIMDCEKYLKKEPKNLTVYQFKELKIKLLLSFKNLKEDFELLWESLDSKVLIIPFKFRELGTFPTSSRVFLEEFGCVLKMLNYSFIAFGLKENEANFEIKQSKGKKVMPSIFDSYFIISRPHDELEALDILVDAMD